MDFKEAVHTSELPQLLRDGLQALMFSEYSMTAALYPSITTEESSDNEREYLIEQAMFGTLPTVGEGDPYPELATPGLYPERVVANTKKGAIFAVTEEMIKFDKLGYIKDQVMDFGRVAKETTEDLVATVYTTAGNYTLNSTTNDNDIGANTAATRFSAQGLELAFSTLATGKDRRSGRYLNIVPDTLIYGPRLEFAVRQLLDSPILSLGGVGTQTGGGTVLHGQGVNNPFRSLIPNRYMWPKLGAYEWIMLQGTKAVKLFTVEPFQLLIQDVRSVENEGYFIYDKLRYRARVWNGAGMWNQRFAYYSSDTVGPEIR